MSSSFLKLPVDFVPNNEDGEVDSFRLIPVPHAANIIRRTEFFKPNCNLVIIDFLFHHGYIHPDSHGYLYISAAKLEKRRLYLATIYHQNFY
ncbi:unnamed protein product [Urochloa humidicola]